MYSNCQVTVGLIFMNPKNYHRFMDTLGSILKNRFYSIQLLLIDNTGEDFFTFATSDNLFRSAVRTDTGESMLGRFKDYIVPEDEFSFYKNSEIKSVAVNWNTIYKYSDTPVVIFCNDDIIVNEYYDKYIYDTVFGDMFYHGDNSPVGVCSFPEVYPHPVLVNEDWNMDNCRGKYIANSGVMPIIEGFNGACWGTRKTLLEEVARRQPENLPFDERYKLACYEDLDFYEVASGMGYRFNLCYQTFVFHYGASTRNSEIMDDLQQKHTEGMYHIEYNRKLFLEKWKMTEDELKRFEDTLYKGWNDPDKNHPLWHRAQELVKETMQ